MNSTTAQTTFQTISITQILNSTNSVGNSTELNGADTCWVLVRKEDLSRLKVA